MKKFLLALCLTLVATASKADDLFYASTAYDLTVDASQVDSQPLNAYTQAVRVVCTVDCWFAVLSSTADTFKQVSAYILAPADVPMVIKTNGESYVTAVSASSGTLNITELSK
jgi:hypothetical protein